jgi:hypothetical protein
MNKPHNLDIEITALRDGWGDWCEEYKALDDRRLKLEAALREAGERLIVLGGGAWGRHAIRVADDTP